MPLFSGSVNAWDFIDESTDRRNYSAGNSTKPYVLMLISSVLAGLGNSLEPLSLCAWLHLFFLVLAFDIFFESLIFKHLEHDYIRKLYNVSTNWWILYRELYSFMLYAVIIQSFGFCIGFSTVTGYPNISLATVFLSFLVGVIYWFVYVAFVFLPYYYYQKRFAYPLALANRGIDLHFMTERDRILRDSSSESIYGRIRNEEESEIGDRPRQTYTSQLVVVPILFTAISHVIIGKYFSTFLLVSNAVLDLAPLKSLASLFGLAGVTFAVVLVASVLVNSYFNEFRMRRLAWFILAFVVTLLTLSSLIGQSSMLFQKDVAKFLIKSVPVSCVMGQNIPYSGLRDTVDGFDYIGVRTVDHMNHQDEGTNKLGTTSLTSHHTPTRHGNRILTKVSASDSEYDKLLDNTRKRIRKGDIFVLWPETAVSIAVDDSEEEFIEEMRLLFEQETLRAFLAKEGTGAEVGQQQRYSDKNIIAQKSVHPNHDVNTSGEERFLGITYLKQHSYSARDGTRPTASQTFSTNHFVLLTSYYIRKREHPFNDTRPLSSSETSSQFDRHDSSTTVLDRHKLHDEFKTEVVWNYRKSHPVPVIEFDVVAGPSKLPVYRSKMYGNIGGAICFDMDFPDFMIQAGEKNVDIMLQASWTWNDIGRRHFEGDAVRALENGFSLFRCSSVGESGIVDPYGVFVSRIYTGTDPSEPFTFMLPLFRRIKTIYSAVGYTFEYLILFAAIFIYLATFTPEVIVNYVVEIFVNLAAWCTNCTKRGTI